MAQQDRERWNDKYRRGSHASGGPTALELLEPELSRWLPSRGRALDVAAGAGANAVWLARRGLDVTAVDIAEVGLGLAAQRAEDAGVGLTTVQCDLEAQPLPTGPFALVLCSHYLQRDLIESMGRALGPGGRLLWIHPTLDNLQRHARPSARFLLEPGEAQSLVSAAGLQVRWAQEGWVGSEDSARCLARVVAEAGVAES